MVRSVGLPPTDLHSTLDAVWRIESAKLIAALTRLVRDVSLAEELAQDALVAALEQWQESGVPERPGAWLLATARHRAIDALRREGRSQAQDEVLAGLVAPAAEDADLDREIEDDLLRRRPLHGRKYRCLKGLRGG